MRPRIVVFAYSEVGWLCLKELLAQKANVVLVFTHRDDPDEEIWFHSTAELARSARIPVRMPEKIDTVELAAFTASKPELVFSFYYRAMIPEAVLNEPRLGAYNVHGALLPRYRGRACVNWAVLNGETETGATLHVMTAQADRGDIVDSQPVPIAFTDTGLDVFLKVAEAARMIVARSLPALEAGSAIRLPQDETKATKFGRRRPEDGVLLWDKTAIQLYNLVRSVTHPFPGAFTSFNGRKLFVWSACPVSGTGIPGTVTSLCPLRVGTGSGLLELRRVQLEGETESNAGGIPGLSIGTRLGE